MIVKKEEKEDFLVLYPLERVDSSNAQVFETELLTPIQNEGVTKVIIDFSNLNYISSAGLRVLLMAAKITKQSQCSLWLCALKPNILDVLQVSGFASLFQIKQSQNEIGG